MEISATEIKNRLGDYLAEALAGQPIFINRHGRRVAVLLNIEDFERLKDSKPKPDTPLAQACRALASEIKKTHPRQTPSKTLIKELRNERS